MPNERLRAALLQRGVTPADLAEQIGVDPKSVERWITQDRVPYRKHRYKVAALLGTDESSLWPGALSREQVAAAGESEVIAVYPHRWAVPPDAWAGLFRDAGQEIGLLVYSGLFLADDTGLVQLRVRKARTGGAGMMLLGHAGSAAVAQH